MQEYSLYNIFESLLYAKLAGIDYVQRNESKGVNFSILYFCLYYVSIYKMLYTKKRWLFFCYIYYYTAPTFRDANTPNKSAPLDYRVKWKKKTTST